MRPAQGPRSGWLEIISRDRSPAYASGIHEGAPGVVQVADRFHLREALEKVMMQHDRLLRSQTLAAPASTAPTGENDAYAGCRLRLEPHLGRAKRVRRRRASPRLRLPPAREASWVLLRSGELKDEERRVVELLCRLSPEVGRARGLALNSVEVVKERRAEGLHEWLISAQRSGVAEFITFANGLTTDLQAVRAALEYEWSNGQVEGQGHRLKVVKRAMYGRGKLDLLRARVLYAA